MTREELNLERLKDSLNSEQQNINRWIRSTYLALDDYTLDISPMQRDLMIAQLRVMRVYIDILNLRRQEARSRHEATTTDI